MVDCVRGPWRAWRLSLAALATALLLSPAAAPAQESFRCAALQPSRSQQPAYQRLPGRALCEGFFEQHVSQPFVELVSLTRGPPDAAASSLRISALRSAAARLVVHPLRSGPFYRVDALIDPGQTLEWDAAPMLAATGLRLRDLGFLGLALTRDDEALTVLPLSLSAPPAPGRSVQAVLRASVAVRSLEWRRYRLDGSAGSDDAGWRAIAGPPLFAWARVPLALELPDAGQRVNVDVQAVDTAGKALPMLRFVLVGAD